LKTTNKRQAARAGRNGSLKQELANGVENHEIILMSKMARHRLTPQKDNELIKIDIMIN